MKLSPEDARKAVAGEFPDGSLSTAATATGLGEITGISSSYAANAATSTVVKSDPSRRNTVAQLLEDESARLGLPRLERLMHEAAGMLRLPRAPVAIEAEVIGRELRSMDLGLDDDQLHSLTRWHVNVLAEIAANSVAVEDDTVYLREVDAGTPNACWVICAKGDPGAVMFAPVDPLDLPPSDQDWLEIAANMGNHMARAERARRSGEAEKLPGEPFVRVPEAERYDAAVTACRNAGKVSTSLVQRKLQIGFNAASALIERMEAEGVCGRRMADGTRKLLS